MSASGSLLRSAYRQKASSEGDADRQRDDHIRMAEPGGGARVGQAEDERRDARRQQREPEDVQLRLDRGGVVPRQVPRGQNQARDAERHVHPEHEPPAQVGQDGAADERAEDRPEQGGQRDQGDGPAERLAPCGLHDQRRQDREQETAADPLDDPPGDQGVDVPGQAGADGPDQEHGQREHPQPLAPEPPQRPGGKRHRHAQGEQVAGGDPLNGRDGRVQLGRERVQGDADDGGVEDHGDEADHQDEAGLDDLRVDLVVGRGGRGHATHLPNKSC